MARPPMMPPMDMEYFGTDMPESAGAPSGAPTMSPIPPGGPGTAEAPPPPGEPDGYEEDAEVIAEAALRYMGVDINTIPPEQMDQVLMELQQGYPDDARLQQALSNTMQLDATRSAVEQVPGAPMPLPPETSMPPMSPGPRFKADQPY